MNKNFKMKSMFSRTRKLFFVSVLSISYLLCLATCKKETESSKSTAKDILSFTIEQQVDSTKIDKSASTINLTVKYGVDVTKLAPVITVSEKATITPASGAITDFTQPVTYKVTAEDKTSLDWKVTVKIATRAENKIDSFYLDASSVATLANDSVLKITVYKRMDITQLKPVIKISDGATIAPASGTAVDGTSGTLSYVVTSADGEKRNITVKITKSNFYAPLIGADNNFIQYVGRFDFSKPTSVKVSAAGAYIKAKFKGTYCDIVLKDQNRWSSNYNYFQVIVDNNAPVRYRTSATKTIFRVAENLPDAEHTVTIIKDSEAQIGQLYFEGFVCDNLLELPAKPERKIECYGNSITCGADLAADTENLRSSIWYVLNEASQSYGAITASNLNAQYHLTSYSGIGLMKSCCNMTDIMPAVFDRTFIEESTSAKWDFTKYVPDVVTICLGQNDGVQDSAIFCSNYISFIGKLREKYPNAQILLLTSPMSDDYLCNFMKKMLTAVESKMAASGDVKVHKVFLTNKLNKGYNTHPDRAQHLIIAAELEKAIKDIMGW